MALPKFENVFEADLLNEYATWSLFNVVTC